MKSILIYIFTFAFSLNILSQSEWQKTNGLAGGPVNSVLEQGTKLYAGTNNGIFRSNNSGGSFAPLGIYDHQIIQITILNSRLYAVDGNYLLFRSANDGSSWSDITANIPGGYCQELVIHKSTLFAVTSGNGLYRSTNNGNNWVLMNNGLSTGYFTGFVSTANYLYVSSGTSLYRSVNNGNSWETLLTDLPAFYSINKMGAYNNTILANLATSGGSLLYRSTNNGVNWIQTGSWNLSFYVSSFAVSGAYLFASVDYDGVLRSQDAGASWQMFNSGISGAIINSNLHLNQGTSKIYVSASSYLTGGLMVNSSNDVWSDLSGGILNGYVNDMLMTGNALYAATDNGSFKSVNNGTSYTQLTAGIAGNKIKTLAAKDNNLLYAGTSDSGVYYSVNAGVSWVHSQLNDKYVASLTVKGAIVYAGTNFDGVYRLTDNGMTWSQTSIINRRILSLAAKDNYVYAGTSSTHGKPSGSVIVSTDNGISWNDYPVESPSFPVLSIGIFDNNRVIAATSYAVYVSTNYGANWVKVNSGNKIGTPSKLVIMGFGDVYVSNSKGVAGSYNYGKTWENTSYGLLSKNCGAIAGNLNWLFVSPDYMGIWKLNLLAESQSAERNSFLSNNPVEFSLEQNYPNPFNPVTRVDFSVPTEGTVKIVLFDCTGREIKTLVNNDYQPGRYSITITGEGIASGVYFYKMTGINFSKTMKMLLVK